MKLFDTWTWARRNLRQRKSRTRLTVVGVFMGCALVVTMLAIRFGLSEQTTYALAEMGDLTQVTVYGQGMMGGEDATPLDEAAMESIRQTDHVVGASPKLSLDDLSMRVRSADGRYVRDYVWPVAMDPASMADVGYAPQTGTGLSTAGSGASLSAADADAAKQSAIEAVAGQWFAYGFADTYQLDEWGSPARIDYWESATFDEETGDYTYGDLPDPYLDVLDKNTNLVLELISNEDDSVLAEFPLVVKGVFKEDYSRGSETSDGMVISVADALTLMSAASPGKKPEVKYSEALVKVDDLANVKSVDSAITSLGFQTYSMESVREPLEEQNAQQQRLLIVLGIIAGVIAAVGVANTMVMAITERKREIGIVRAMGTLARDVRRLYLTESALIGLRGGLWGCVASLVLVVVVNMVSAGDYSLAGLQVALFGAGEKARMMVTPPWLYSAATAGSMLVGLVAGYLPARSASKLQVIEAIRA